VDVPIVGNYALEDAGIVLAGSNQANQEKAGLKKERR
jgi:hypothetical protein